MRFLVIFLFPLLALPDAKAQFDWGISAGWSYTDLYARPEDDPHIVNTVGNVTHGAWPVSLFYREQYADRVGIGAELTWTQRSFWAGYRYSSLGGGGQQWGGQAHLHLFQLGLKPEVYLDKERNGVPRFGLMTDLLAGGTIDTDIPPKGTGSYLLGKIQGGWWFAFGLGLRVPMGERWAIHLDPEADQVLNSVAREVRAKGSTVALRIGLARVAKGRAVTLLLKRDRSGGPGD